MAGLRTSRNSTPISKDELAGRVCTKSSNIPTFFPDQTSALNQAFFPAPALILPSMYTNIDQQKVTKLAPKLFVKGKKYSYANSAFWDRACKACNLNLYYEILYMECFYFCQQQKNYFNTAGAINLKNVFLQLHFSKTRSTSTGNSIRLKLNETVLSLPIGSNLRSFSNKILEIYLIFDQYLDEN